MKFEWDDNKNKANQKKHKISFDRAQQIFFNEETLMSADPLNDDEDRYLAIGYDDEYEILIVVHCYRSNDEVIRIISARKATKTEQRQFEEAL